MDHALQLAEEIKPSSCAIWYHLLLNISVYVKAFIQGSVKTKIDNFAICLLCVIVLN